jgi:pimeloyl-ACP methyl ester carboxylesterase
MWLRKLLVLGFTVSSCSLGFATSHYIGTNLKKPRVIVFVHGLWGNPDSWRASNTAYWPEMMSGDSRFSHSDVFVGAGPT